MYHFQLPRPQLKPLLPCDMENDLIGFGSRPSSSTTFSTQQTVTYKPAVKIKKEETNEVSSANSVYSFEPKIYNQTLTPIKTEKKDVAESSVFFSGLNNQVKVNRKC